ncbi:MAG: hypothetical protein ACLSAP_03580 [Oscillospiraceae bacterium]
MKKRVLCFCLTAALLLAGCSTKPSDAGSSSDSPVSDTADYSHLKDSEWRYGGSYVGSDGNEYLFGYINPNSELSELGVFRKTGMYNYYLLINLGANPPPSFWENDCLYLVSVYLIKYNLTDEQPEKPVQRTQIFPPDTDIDALYTHDDEWLYVSARLWNEEAARHDDYAPYAVRRDGSEYKKITHDEIPYT